jgi:hypothetical protein
MLCGGEAQDPQNDRELLEKSSLYREFVAEREEILRHKWLESPDGTSASNVP